MDVQEAISPTRAPWSDKDDAALKDLRQEGMTLAEIAKRLHKPYPVILYRVGYQDGRARAQTELRHIPTHHKASRTDQRLRNCLHCHKPFVAPGPFIRMCDTCRSKA